MAPTLDLPSWRAVIVFRRRFFVVMGGYRLLCSNGSLELSTSHHFILSSPVLDDRSPPERNTTETKRRYDTARFLSHGELVSALFSLFPRIDLICDTLCTRELSVFCDHVVEKASNVASDTFRESVSWSSSK